MKKIISAMVAAVVFCVGAVGCLIGCGDNMPSSTELQYNVKYIKQDQVRDTEDKQSYYTFNKDGTGKFHYYFNGITFTDSYTVSFKYVFTKSDKTTAVCFYDSVEYDVSDTRKDVKSTWTSTVEASENVVDGYNGWHYINENYMSEIPNFGK